MDNSFENIFNKEFILTSADSEPFVLPGANVLFHEPQWKIDRMLELKRELNEDVKAKLNNYDLKEWHEHTKNLNPAGNVIQHIRKTISPEYCSQAWLKFFEMTSRYQLIPDQVFEASNDGLCPVFNSLHLCEAPGAFISALNHYLKNNHPEIKWSWRASSLNPHHEGNSTGTMINTDVLILNSFSNWTFLNDDTGNIINSQNIQYLRKWVKDEITQVHLITADGSIDCQYSPGDQELLVANLHFAEILSALLILEKGGSFVLKVFTFFEHQSICQLYLLSCLFEFVTLFKPCTSKEGNSEVYVVCLNYKGIVTQEHIDKLLSYTDTEKLNAIFPLDSIPERFLEKIYEAQRFYLSFQIEVINKNIAWYPANISLNQIIELTKNQIVDEWVDHFPLKEIKKNQRIFEGYSDKSWKSAKWRTDLQEEKYEDGSFLEKLEKISLSPENKLIVFKQDLQKYKNEAEMIVTVKPKIYKESIKFGKPYENILSSRFCPSKILHIRQEFREIIEKLPNNKCSSTVLKRKRIGDDEHMCERDTPMNKKVKFLEQFNLDSTSNVKRICFKEKFEDFANKKDIELTLNSLMKLLRILKTLSVGQSIFLCQFPLITRLHIGFIFGICRLFENVYITAKCDGNERGIMLERFKKSISESDESLKNIELLLNSKNEENHVLLEIFPINSICDPNYFKCIVSYNMKNIIYSVEEFIQQSL